jgi:Domain of unknown function (DUF4126)
MDTNTSNVVFSIALASVLAWASGLRLYLTVLVVGVIGYFGWMGLKLPEALKVLQSPWVLGAAGLMVAVEFFADKIPGLDSFWDALHTFIRIPAGALLAMGVSGDELNAMTIAAGILGGTITAGTHFTKAGTRLAINTSPEPVTNVSASLGEEALVVGGIATALLNPWIFLVLLALFILLALWLVPKLWRFFKAIVNRIKSWLGFDEPKPADIRNF